MLPTQTPHEHLREALLLHQELEDIHNRLQLVQALPLHTIWSSVKNAVSQATAAVKKGVEAVHAQLNKLPTAQEVSNYLHNKFKVPIAQDLNGNLHADINGVRVEVTVSADKTTWQVAVNGGTNTPVKSLEDMGNFVDAHTRAGAQPPPTQAVFKDILRHSKIIQQSKPF